MTPTTTAGTAKKIPRNDHRAPGFPVPPDEIRAIKKNYREFRINIPGVALWEFELRSGNVRAGIGLATLLGLEPAGLPQTIRDYLDIVPPEEQAAVRQQMNEHLLGRTPFFKIRHHMKTSAGKILWCITCGRITLRGRDGLPERLVGSTCEAVFYQRNQRRLGRIMRALTHERRSKRGDHPLV